MSSLKKRTANRENGKLGGPKTAEGRAKSARNSTKHGLAGNTLVLTGESLPKYTELLNAYVERFQPADEVELDLIVEAVACRWRIRRIWSIESSMIAIEIDDQHASVTNERGNIDDDSRMALAFSKLAEGKGLALLSRYESRFRRQFDRALANLESLQKQRKAEKTQALPFHAKPAAAQRTENDQTNPPNLPISSHRPAPILQIACVTRHDEARHVTREYVSEV